MDTVDVVAAAGAGDGGVACGGVTAQFQTSRDGDALHAQVKVAAGFAEGRQREKTWSKYLPPLCRLNCTPMLEGGCSY